MVAVGDNEPVFVSLHCILEAGRNKDRRLRQVSFRPGTNVGNYCEGVRAIHPVDADDIVALQIRSNAGDQSIGDPAEEGNIYHPTALKERVRDSGGKAAGEESCFAALSVNSPYASGEWRGHIQVRAGTDRTALEFVQTCNQWCGFDLNLLLATHIWLAIIAASQHTNKDNTEGKPSSYTKDVSCRGEAWVRLFKHNIFFKVNVINVRIHALRNFIEGSRDNTKNQLPNVVVKSAVGSWRYLDQYA